MFKEFEQYLTELDCSKNTIRNYTLDLRTALNNSIVSIDLNTLNLDKITKLSVGSSTMHRIRASIRKYARFLVASKQLTVVPPEIDALELPKICTKMPKVSSIAKVKAIIDRTKDKKARALLYLLASTGARISSIAALRVEDIGENEITFTKAKGRKSYKVPLPLQAKEAVLEFLNGRIEGFVFCGPTGKETGADCQRLYLSSTLKEDYIPPHSIRHGFATMLVENKMDIVTVSDLLNHTSVSTTQRYIHLSTEIKRQQLKDAHPFFKELGKLP